MHEFMNDFPVYGVLGNSVSGYEGSRKPSFRLAQFSESREGVVWDTAQDRAGCTLRADARPDDHRAVPVRVHQRCNATCANFSLLATRPTWQVHQDPEDFVLRPGWLASAIHGAAVNWG